MGRADHVNARVMSRAPAPLSKLPQSLHWPCPSECMQNSSKPIQTARVYTMSPLREMQLRASLSAVDDVDADSDTLDDLLDGVDDEVCSSMMGHDSTSESSDTDDSSSISDNDVFNGTVCGEPVDAGQLRALEQEGTRRIVLLHAHLQCGTRLAHKGSLN